MKRSLRNQTLIGHWFNRHCLLEQAVEQLSPVSRQSPVEAEREFIQVIVEVLPGDPPLVNAQEPPFQQGGNTVDSRQKSRGGLATAAYHAGEMDLPQAFQPGIGGPPIGDDEGSRNHGLLDKGCQALRRGVGDLLHSNPTDPRSFDLRRDRDQGFGAHVSFASALLHTTNEDLVYLDVAAQPLPTGTDHGPPQLVQAGPGRSVTAQAEGALQPHGTYAALLVGDPPDDPEPHPQGQMAAVEDRPGRHRHHRITALTLEEAVLQGPGPSVAAVRAAESLGPSQPDQIGPAGFLGAESVFEFQECSGIVFVHPPRLPEEVT